MQELALEQPVRPVPGRDAPVGDHGPPAHRRVLGAVCGRSSSC